MKKAMKIVGLVMALALCRADAPVSAQVYPGGGSGSLSTPVSVANGGTASATGVGLVDTCTDSVGTDSYACSTATTCPADLANTRPVLFTAGTANTDGATFAYCSLAAKAIVKTVGGISTALATNDILAKQPVLVRYNATDDNWKMISAVSNAPAGSLAVGGAITSGTANRVLYENSSNQLAESAGLTFDGATLTVNNGASAVTPFNVQDNGISYFRIVDGGNAEVANLANVAWSLTGGGSMTIQSGTATTGNSLSLSRGTGDITLLGMTSRHTFLMDYSEASTSAINSGFTIGTNVGAASNGFGTGLLFQGQSSTTVGQSMVRVSGVWTDATHASRSAAVVFETVNGAAALAEVGRFNAVGGLKIATGSKPACDSSVRGTLYYVAGGAGVADTYEACRKDAADAYAWVAIY